MSANKKYVVYSHLDTQENKISLRTDGGNEELVCPGKLRIGSTDDPTRTCDITGSVGITSDTSISGDLSVDGNTFFVDSSTHRVGINKAAPAKTLDVVGTLKTAGHSTIGGTVSLTKAAGSTGLEVTANASIGGSLSLTKTTGNTLVVATNTLAVDATNDSVGIGISTAQYGKLDVRGSKTITRSMYINSKIPHGGDANVVSSDGLFCHVFTQSGTFHVFETGNFEVFLVGGGGAGGSQWGGGGGGGGIYYNYTLTLTAGTYTVTVGGGGSPGYWISSPSADGGETSIKNASNAVMGQIAKGGGHGWGAGDAGSGGGGKGNTGSGSFPSYGGNSTQAVSGNGLVYGNRGGPSAAEGHSHIGGGGGGAQGVGAKGSTWAGGNGGAGLGPVSWRNIATIYGAGGGGSRHGGYTWGGRGGSSTTPNNSTSATPVPLGAGGRGGLVYPVSGQPSHSPQSGSANTGAGGGGSAGWGGGGGSGVAMIRWNLTGLYSGTTYSNYDLGTTIDTANVSIAGEYGIRARSVGFLLDSDSRIKKDIQDISDGAALNLIRQLQPKTYKYKNINLSNSVYGFLAQDVKSVLPHSVFITSDFIPDVFRTATVTNGNTLTLTAHGLTEGASISLKNPDKIVRIISVPNADTFTISESLNVEQVTVYGTFVQDYHTLNKDAIWTVSTAALQEVDRQLQTKKAKTVSNEIKLETIETEIAAIKSHLNL